METKIIDYNNGIYAIDQEMVRCFLIVGKDKAVLLDTGAISIDIKKYLSEITDKEIQVVLTHGDIDHITNLSVFDDVYLHQGDEDLISDININKHYLNDGDIIDLQDRVLEVIYTPGHTNGSICLLDRQNKILFSGDTVSYGPIFMFGSNRNINTYLKSLELLKNKQEAGDFNKVYCCHNACPVSDDVIDELIECSESIINKTCDYKEVNLPISSKEKIYIVKAGKSALLTLKD